MDKEILYRFFNGTASHSEEELVRRWIESSEANRKTLLEERKLFDMALLHTPVANGGQIARLTARVIPILKETAKIAAVVAIAVTISYLLMHNRNESKTTEPLAMQTISVPAGQRINLTLPDNSSVWLNAGTTVRYNTGFGTTNRQLELSGEASLEVTKNEHLPFIVQTGDIRVEVTGTHFNVRAYDNDQDVKVALMEGSVSISAANRTVRLSPGEMALYNRTSHKLDVLSDAVADASEWINNRIVFRGETFEQIVRTLERHFDVKVIFRDDRIKNSRFTGEFVNNERVEEIFRIMSAGKKFRYRINGNEIEIY